MPQPMFHAAISRTGKILILLILLLLLFPVAFLFYKFAKGMFFPRIDKTAVSTINRETGEREYLRLGPFSRIQGTELLTASLGASHNLRDFYYSSYAGYNSKIRNYLFFDIKTKRTRWLRPDNSSLFLNSHQLLDDINALKKSLEHNWAHDGKLFRDETAKVISIVYEAVLADSNADHRLTQDDKKTLLFMSLSDSKLISLAENLDEILGVEQVSNEEAVIFLTREQKNFALSINSDTGEAGPATELAAIGAER